MATPPFSPLIDLADGNRIPQLGLGVYKVEDSRAAALVEGAIDAGYRHIDTAKLYFNEAGVGAGVRASGVPREELFVTTKVWNDDHGYDETLRAFDTSLGLLGLDYVDLYLIHWPSPRQNRYVETWRALETLKADARVRSIGVSNFTGAHLERLAAGSTVVPAVNQIELHPYFAQKQNEAANTARGIVTQAWSPIGGITFYPGWSDGTGKNPLTDPVIAAIGAVHGKTNAQVMLRWHLQQGRSVIPKSVRPERIAENIDVFDFELSGVQLAQIDALDLGVRGGPDPDAVRKPGQFTIPEN